jgi:outer membrane protein assembly factor BamA
MKLIFSLTLFIVSTTSLAQENRLIINDIQISGNRRTREDIILRELTFRKGDTIPRSYLEFNINRSRQNILNTSLFNYVTISLDSNSAGSTDVIISVEERWYIWPAVIYKYEDRNFSAWLKAKDLSKSKYGFSLEKINCFGRKENLKISFFFGYATQFRISYKNIALDHDRRHFIGADAEISKQDEMIFNTRNNEPVTFKSYNYPVFEQRKYTLNYTFRPYLNDLHNLYLNYYQYKVADTIIKLNPEYLGNKNNNQECITFDYVYSKDKRDIRAYPLRGSFFEVNVGQTFSMPFTKSSFRSTVIIPNYYKYVEISNRFYYAANVSLKLSYNTANSYFYSKSLGYTYNLHGFEYNTIEGQHFILFRNLIKFAVLKPRISEITFIPLPKFNKIHYAVYLNVFTDCGYVANKYKTTDNNYSNTLISSIGAGVDLVTYYDKTFRAEYSINSFGITGFYFHLNAPLNR